MTKIPQYMLYYVPELQNSSRRRGIFRKEGNAALKFVGHGSRRNRDVL